MGIKFHTEEKDGFAIDVHAIPEDMDPASHFDDDEIVKNIESGKYHWFTAKVTASKNGIVLASEYLGGCCYESLEDFIKTDCYFSDMRESAIKEAKQVILELNK